MTKSQNTVTEAVTIFNKAYHIYQSGNHLVTLRLYDGTQVSGILQGSYFQGSSRLPADQLPNPGTIEVNVEGATEAYNLFTVREIE